MRLIVTHKNADFDAVASLVAAGLLFPAALPVLPHPVNPNVNKFLSLHKEVFKLRSWKEIDVSAVSGLVVVDACRWDRLSVPREIRERQDLEITLFDHHPEAGDIPANRECREPVGAAITLLLRYLKDARISPIHATLFLAGLHEDTGSLSFPGTTAEDFRAGAFLLERKADLGVLGYLLRPSYSDRQQEILFEMMGTAVCEKVNGYNVAISKIRLEGFVDGLALVVKMYRDIIGVDAVFAVFEESKRGGCMVIARSEGEQIDVGSIMHDLGGGGHAGAASAFVKTTSMDGVENRIRSLLAGKQNGSVRVADLMSFPVVVIREDASVAEADRLMKERRCSGVPVVDASQRLAGVISRWDIQKRVKKESQLRGPVRALMSTQVVTTQPDQSPVDVSRLMIQNDIGRLPVIEDDNIIGIVTRSDMMRYLYDLVPED